jgi:hypothetical protein
MIEKIDELLDQENARATVMKITSDTFIQRRLAGERILGIHANRAGLGQKPESRIDG